jgi:uncharacterized protein RhaS with RHS repeats
MYDFPYREYPIQGRWPSPDPAGLAAVSLANPQTWNRYAYVTNNPLSLIDPSGMNDCPDLKSTCGDDWLNPCAGAAGVDLYGGGPGGANCGNGSLNGNNCEWTGTCAWQPTSPLYAGGCPAEYQGCVYLPNGSVIAISRPGEGYLFYMGPFEDSRTGWSSYYRPYSWDPTGGGGSTLDNRASALAKAVNNTGVQSLGNPCTVAVFYGGSAALGFAGGAAAGGQAAGAASAVKEASAPYWPAAFNWLYRQAMTGFPAIRFMTKAYNTTTQAVQAGCNAVQ